MTGYQFLFSFFEQLPDIRTALIGLFAFLILSWVAQNYLYHVKNLPPGPRGWPVLGGIPQMLMKMSLPFHENVHSLYQKYGPVCHVPLPLGKRAVLVSGYKAVHEVLTLSEFNSLPPMTSFGGYDEILKGLGILMASGEPWKEHRKFSQSALRGFGVGKRSFEEQIATESECLMKEIKSYQSCSFDPTQLFCNAVSNVICSVVLGKRFEYDDPEFKHLLHLLEDELKHPGADVLLTTMPFLLKIPFFPKGALPSDISIRQKLKDIVDEHRASFDGENLRDFIDVYINDMRLKEEQSIQTNLNDFDLVAVVHDLYLAGTETTSTTLRWALLYMLNYPDVQKRVHEEIDNIVGRDRLPKLSDKPNLPYTLAVIHEIQRYASIVFISNIRFTTKDTEFQGFTIPKDSYVVANLFSVTRDPSVWENPDAFQPERFLDDKEQFMKSSKQTVFGAGKRVCLGEQLARMELFIFFTHLMHQFSFKKATATDRLNIRPNTGSVLAPFPYNICAIART